MKIILQMNSCSDSENSDICSYTYSPEILTENESEKVTIREAMNREPLVIDDVSPVLTENEEDVVDQLLEKEEEQIHHLPTTQMIEIAVLKEKEEKKNRRSTRSTDEEEENRYRFGNKEGFDSSREFRPHFSTVCPSINLDQGISSSCEYDIRDFDISLLDGETIRSEKISPYFDGIHDVCPEANFNPKERIRYMKIFLCFS